MERVIAYVDGYNLYYSLRSKGWKWFYWLNLQALVQRLLKPRQTLTALKYFTTIITEPDDKRRRQTGLFRCVTNASQSPPLLRPILV
jgi:hypothetical protein